MNARLERYATPVAVAVALHVVGVLALGLAHVDTESDDQGVTEVIIEEPPEPPPEPPPPEPEPPPEPQPEPEPPPPPKPKPKPKVEPEPRPEPAKPAKPASAPEAPQSTEPAPGAPEPVNPGGMIRMDDLGPGGTVAATPGNGKTPGPGGSGTGTGGGGGKAGGSGPPKPVSIASIKRKAMPIGDTDFTRIGDYPPEAKQRRIEGDVVVRLVVDERGRVVSRRIIKGLGHGLDRRALALAKKLRFEPAVDANDRPVTSVVPWTFTFTLP